MCKEKLVFPFIPSLLINLICLLLFISNLQSQTIGEKTVGIHTNFTNLKSLSLNKQQYQTSVAETIVSLNDGIAEGIANPQIFDLDGNGLIDPNGSLDYLFVVFEPSDFAAYGLEFPIKITGASFYNNSSLTIFPEVIIANVAGSLESGATVDLYNPLAVEEDVSGPTEGFANVTFSLAPTIFQETAIALLFQFPQGEQYTGVGENGGPGIGLDFDGADNPQYPPPGIPERNGNSFVYDLTLTDDSWQLFNTADNEPINLMMNLLVEAASLPVDVIPPQNLQAIVDEDTVYLDWQPPSTVALAEFFFDDGSFESYYGFDNGIGILANGPYIPPSYPATITHVKFLTSGAKTGTNVTINIYVDLTGTAISPSSAFLAGSIETTISTGGEFQTVDLSPLAITMNSGQFFVGIESMSQGNIELGNDDHADGLNWFDSTLDGIFDFHDVPGVYAIRSIVSIPNSSPGSTYQQLTLKPTTSIHASSVFSKGNATSYDVTKSNFSKVSIPSAEMDAIDISSPLAIMGLQRYKIYRSTEINAKSTGTVVGEVDVNTLTFTDSDPPANTYYYAVTANYEEGESDPSNEVMVVIAGDPPVEEPVDPPPNLVAWWKGENNAADSSGHNNHGALQNGTTFETGKVGQSFSFDGDNDFISANSDILGGAAAATIEGWIYLKSYAANGQSTIIIDRKPGFDDFQFAVAPDNNLPHKLFFHFWNSAGNNYFAPSTTDIPLNTWTHVAGVYDGAEIRIYINGNQDGVPVAAVGSIRSISDNLQIGDDLWNPSFNGRIDELSIYDRALTDQEIQSIFAAGSAGKKGNLPEVPVSPPDGLISWWSGDGNANDIVNGNHGTPKNGASFVNGFITTGNGQAFSFDGVDDYIEIPSSPDLNPDAQTGFTVEAWALTKTTTGNGAVIGKGPPYTEQYVIDKLSGAWRAFIRNTNNVLSIITGPAIVIDRFTHLALTWDNPVLSFYVDGQLVGTASSSSIRASDAYLGIGGRSNANGNVYFDGIVDEASIYNRALTANEIRTIFNSGSTGKDKAGIAQTPDIVATPDTLDFENVTVGENKELQLTIRNTGNANLTIHSISSSDPQFRLVSVTTPFDITVNNQQSITVRFTPTSAGSQSGTLTINSNDPDEATVNVSLLGNGIQVATLIPAPAGLIAWWKGEGNAADSSGNKNHGQFSNNATTAAGLVGQALLFSGGSDAVIIPDSPELNPAKQLTIEAWIYANSLPNVEPIIVNKEIPTIQPNSIQYELAVNNGIAGNVQNSQLIFYIGGVSQTIPDAGNGWNDGGGPIQMNKWTHVALTVDLDSGKVRSYVDGIKTEYDVPANLAIVQTNGDLRIGNRSQINMPFDGSIDELSIYNRALLKSEIQSIISAGSAGKKKTTLQFPNIVVTPDSLDFEDVMVGENKELQFTIQNTGNETLTVQSIANSNQQFTLVSVTTPFQIASNNQQSVTVRFAPTTEGNHKDSLDISSDDPDETKVKVQLNGNGVILVVATPTFTPSPGTFDSPQDITINTTTADAQIYYTTNGSDPAESDSLYTSPVRISSSIQLKARATRENWTSSMVASGIYTIRSAISGKVLDYQNQDPIEGAQVDVTGIISKSTRTDAAANYNVTKLLTGYSYKVEPFYPGMFFQPPAITYPKLGKAQINQNFIGSLFGDVSGNDQVKAYDAAMVLLYAVDSISLQNITRDSIAADVSGDGTIKSFDASLILRKSVGKISSFPVESFPLLKSTLTAGSTIVRLEGNQAENQDMLITTVFLENANSLYSADLVFSIDPIVLKLSTITKGKIAPGFQIAHSSKNKKIKIGMAGTDPVSSDGQLLILAFDILSNVRNPGAPILELKDISFDERTEDIQLLNRSIEVERIPTQFRLFQNHPNPFNAETIIRYQIPANPGSKNGTISSTGGSESVFVKLKIMNLLGHEVLDLVNTHQMPGEYEVIWNGKDRLGNSVSSGIYFYLIQAGDFTAKRKMLLLQ